MNPLYNAGITLYRGAVKIAALRNHKAATMLAGQRTAIDDILTARTTLAHDGFDVWFHAASLGEFEQARPLIEKLKHDRPDITICLSFFSPSGYEVRKNYPLVDCVVYLPFDTPRRARQFVDAIAPHMAIFVKYEFWGNILEQLYRRHVPTYLISAIFRPTQIFFKPYGRIFRDILQNFTHIYVQDDDSQQLLAQIGVTDVTVAGDTRFDRVTAVKNTAIDIPALARWTAHSPLTLIVGSSWQEDEKRYTPWINQHPDLKAIIAPHEFDDRRLHDLRSTFQANTALWSEIKNLNIIPDDIHIIIIDTFGLLSSLYRYADIAIVGGGFGAGIHNINEAAVYGIPVIFGPRHQKFREATQLIKCGAAFQYTTADDLDKTLQKLALNPMGALSANNDARAAAGKAASQYITINTGATNKILSDILGTD